MDEIGEKSNGTTVTNETMKRESILKQARENIEKKRSTSLTAEGLKPNTEYDFRSFPVGTSVRAMVLVGSERLKELYPSEAENVGKIYEGLGDEDYRSRYLSAVHERFAALVPEEPLLWESTSRLGEEDYKFADEAVNRLRVQEGGLEGVQGHCVLWAKRAHLPEYLRGADKQQVVKELYERRLGIIKRYPEVKRWVLVNEPLQHTPRVVNGVDRNELVLKPEKDIDTYVELFKKAKEDNPDTTFIVNEYNVLSGEKVDEYADFIRELIARGASIGGIGVQGHVGSPDSYSVERVQESLEKLGRLGLPIIVTEFDVPAKAFEDENGRAKYVKDILTLFYGNRYVEEVYIWGIQDKTHWRGKEGAGFYDENFNSNEVGVALEQRQEDWTTKTTATTDSEGKAMIVGFPGIYRVTDRASGKFFPKII